MGIAAVAILAGLGVFSVVYYVLIRFTVGWERLQSSGDS